MTKNLILVGLGCRLDHKLLLAVPSLTLSCDGHWKGKSRGNALPPKIGSAHNLIQRISMHGLVRKVKFNELVIWYPGVRFKLLLKANLFGNWPHPYKVMRDHHHIMVVFLKWGVICTYKFPYKYGLENYK